MTRNLVSGLMGAALAIGFASQACAQAADEAAQKRAFMVCQACHTVNKGGASFAGPNLFGVIGAKAGTISTYKHSPAMVASGLTWTDANLDKYIANPQATVKGTRMSFMGVKDPAQRQLIIAYLKRVTK